MANVLIQGKSADDRATPPQELSSVRNTLLTGAFCPLTYLANVSVTTSVASAAITAGASKLRVRNIGPTNFAYIAFGTSAADAETNAATGVLIEVDTTEILTMTPGATHYAYLADTNTVTMNIIQGY